VYYRCGSLIPQPSILFSPKLLCFCDTVGKEDVKKGQEEEEIEDAEDLMEEDGLEDDSGDEE
jgi:hypothetical protein